MAFTPVVGADGGSADLVVVRESGTACGAWLPPASEPNTRSVKTQWRYIWGEPISNGSGDLGLPLEGIWSESAFLSDAGVSFGGTGGWIIPQADGFLFVQMSQPCMMCWPWLERWPDGGGIFLGTGYASSTNCTFATRPSGSGVFTSCVGPATDGGVATFAKYDEHLTLLSSHPGDGLDLIAADAQDRILETNSSNQRRWLDSDGNALTAFFPSGAGLQLLIGGGFVDRSGRIVPSGSASVTQAPAWLTERSSVSIVFGGHAYALGDNDCGLVIRDAEGALCGTLNFTNCRTPPRPGFDGTVALPMDPFEYVTEQSLAVWPRLLH